MDKFLINGGKAAAGDGGHQWGEEFGAAGDGGALLTAEKVTLHNIPKVRDLITMSKLLAFMDAKVSVTGFPSSDYEIEAPRLNHAEAPYELVKTMAGIGADAGTVDGAVGNGAGFAAGRMRDRGAAGGFALEGAGTDGRGDRHVARVH